jgi:hypothetical protein
MTLKDHFPGGGEHGIDGIAAGMGEVIATHAVVFLEVADDGLDRSPPFELALDLRREVHALFNRLFSSKGASYERVKFQSKRLHY